MELLKEGFNNQIQETNRRMEDGQKKTEELLEKKMAIMKEELSAELGAVSYTHLDVYKRQILRESCTREKSNL